MPHNPRLHELAKRLGAGIPEPEGEPIRVRFQRNLHTSRGRLVSRAVGMPILGASNLRKRDVVLNSRLRSQPKELGRIVVHELFHFAWARLGNPCRRSYARLIEEELECGARGELGCSAQARKDILRKIAPEQRPLREWREYVCESFCDTAAWLYAGIRTHDEFTLAPRYSKLRAAWFAECFRVRKLLL